MKFLLRNAHKTINADSVCKRNFYIEVVNKRLFIFFCVYLRSGKLVKFYHCIKYLYLTSQIIRIFSTVKTLNYIIVIFVLKYFNCMHACKIAVFLHTLFNFLSWRGTWFTCIKIAFCLFMQTHYLIKQDGFGGVWCMIVANSKICLAARINKNQQ